MKQANLTLRSLALIALISMSSLTQASASMDNESSQGVGYLGILAGGNNSSGGEGSATPTFGVTLGGKIAPNFGLGLLGSYYGQTSSGSLFGLPTGTNTNTIIIAGQGNFFMGGFHAGGEIGTAISSWSGHISSASTGDSTSGMVFGPQAGYDFVIGKTVSLGAEGHYLISTADHGADNIQVFAALKFWQ